LYNTANCLSYESGWVKGGGVCCHRTEEVTVFSEKKKHGNRYGLKRISLLSEDPPRVVKILQLAKRNLSVLFVATSSRSLARHLLVPSLKAPARLPKS